MKRILTSCLVVLICVTAFITGYSKGCYSYADTPVYMSDKELETAYQAYLQSKGGGLIGNAGARFTYMTGKMMNYMTSTSNTTGINTLDQLKSEMSWEKSQIESGRSVLSLALSPRAAGFMNLYTQWLLQNHYFGNGASIDNNGMFEDGTDDIVKSGLFFQDPDGNGCYVYYCDGSSDNVDACSQEGTFYKYDTSYLYQLCGSNNNYTTVSFKLNSNTTSNMRLNIGFANSTPYQDFKGLYADGNSSICRLRGDYYRDSNPVSHWEGNVAIIKNTNPNADQNKLYLGTVCRCVSSNDTVSNPLGKYRILYKIQFTPDNSAASQQNIIFYTNLNNNINVYPTINEGDTLHITPKVNVGVDGTINYQPITINEGDTISNVVNNYYIDSGTPDKTIAVPSDEPYTDNPSGGGGGGNNDNPSGPSGGTPPNWNNPIGNLTPNGSDGFDVNFNMPNLNIDWNISGLQEKFPFSIPFDLIRFINVLNAEPETPEFDFTVDLRIYQWHIDADLHQFDNLAGIVRNVEFIGFCITLIMITRRMIKG